MGSPDLSVWLISVYALIMLAAAWVVDVLGSRSARHSMSWRHSDFVYHDDVDGWRMPSGSRVAKHIQARPMLRLQKEVLASFSGHLSAGTR